MSAFKMKATSSALIIPILVIIDNVKNVRNSCDIVNTEILCTSVRDLRNETLSKIENIESVKRITVRNNYELFLHYSAFNTTTNLEFINIELNKIEKIYPKTFQNLPLNYVALDYDSIKVVYPGAFSNLPKLKILSVTNNNLKTILRDTFSNLPIEDLKLSKNNISSIEPMALENLPNLKKLRLDHNQLDTIFIHTLLTYPKRLQILWLHNNSLTTVTNYMLQKLTNLQVLNLGFNSIFLIEPNSFDQTPKLTTLVLTHNHLKEVSGNIFPRTGLNYLQRFYLDNNKLMFLSSNFFFRLNNLKSITLVGNPWMCPCLDVIHRIIAENDIQEKCAWNYTSGQRPVCVNEKLPTGNCKYTYDQELGDKYEAYKQRNPLHIQPLACLL